MYIIEEEDIEIILMDFNSFFFSAKEYKTKSLYSKDCVVSEMTFNKLLNHLSETSKNVIIDMKNVVSYSPRIFSKLDGFQQCIRLINIEDNRVREMLKEDISSGNWENDSTLDINKNSNLCANYESIINKNWRNNEIIRIIKHNICQEGKYMLESSGLYSNYYVDIKKLFMDVKSYYYIMYSLARITKGKIEELSVDAFVSSSKNGAIIANILGGLLDIKEIHLIGVGPKYAMESGNSMNSIKEGKKYAYIFDFLCTGTELKIVNALIHTRKACLVYAAGIARYKKEHNKGAFLQINTLTDTREMGINYKIAGGASFLD